MSIPERIALLALLGAVLVGIVALATRWHDNRQPREDEP